MKYTEICYSRLYKFTPPPLLKRLIPKMAMHPPVIPSTEPEPAFDSQEPWNQIK